MELISNVVLNMQAPAYATVYSPQGQTLARSIRATLMDGSTPWDVPAGALAVIRYAKPDGTIGFYDTLEDDSIAYSFSGNIITFGLATQALTVPGTVYMQIDFYAEGNVKLSTFTFRLEVQAYVFPDEEIISDDYINVLTGKLSEAAVIFEQIKAAYGAPRTAATDAAMTDHNLIYVYTGTTGGGYTNGHWYYWNGSAWTDGGNYNSTGFTTDKTLTIVDAAADAAATGDVRYEFEINMDNTLCPVDALSWEQGGFTRTTGDQGDSDFIIRTTGYIPSNVVRVSCPATQEMCLYAWDDTTDEFVGHEISSGVFTTNTGGLMRSDCVIDWSKGYKYKLIMTNLDHSTAILPSAGANAIPYVATDETLTESGKAADAKATGDAIKELAKYNAVDLLKDNLLHNNTSYNGVVYTWSSDLSYLTVNGTATGQSWCTLFDGENTMPFGIEAGKTYYVKVKMPVNNLYLTIRQLGVNYTLISQIDADEPLMLTIDPACIGMEIRIQAVVGTTYNNVTVSEFSILNADSNLGLSERLNNLSIDVDATLSVSGKAADAQKTGALAAPVFSASIAYAAGQHVLNNGTLYVFTADHAAGAWTGTDATAVNLGGEISDLKNTINGIAQKLHLEIVGTTGLATNVYTPISKTRNYKVTNETAGTANFNIINADGTYTFLKAISAGASYNYTADNNYPGIRIYYASGGTCVFESDDNGVFAILSTKAETAVIEKKVLDSVGKIDETISGTADLSTNLLIPVYYGRKYKLTNNTSGYVNLNIIKSDGTFLLVDSVSAGATYEYLSDDNYKGIRIYFSTTGNCSFVSSDLGTYMSDTENSLNLIAIRDALIKNNSIDPFVILFDTNLQAFPLPNGTTFTIKKTDGTTFETNSVKMYSSNKTLLNTWNVNATSGTSRTITNNSGDGVYIQITNPSLVGIVIAYANSTQAKIEKIRVMQYNIGMFNYGQTGGLSQDVAIKIANYKKFLGEYQPNICGIEEYTNYIDSDSIYGSDATLFDDLYFYKEPSRAEALAVKSDYPYSAYQTFYVYSGSSDSRITAGMFVEYDANINGISVAVIAGAIAAGRTWEQRSDGFDELMTKLAGKENVIILIDTNVVSQSEHDDLVFIAETAGYSVANGGYFGMFDTYNLNSEHYHKIDNVLVKGDIVLKNVIVPDVYADLSSDHYPIIADVELKT